MAEEAKKEGEEKTPAAAAGGGSNKLVIIIAVAAGVLLLAGAGVAAAVVMSNKKTASVAEVPADAAHSEEEHGAAPIEEELEEGEEALGAIFPLDNFVVNLANGKFLRVQVRLEFTARDVPQRFLVRIPVVRDRLITLLSSKKSDDVLPADGKERLKQEIKDAVNEILRREEVKAVYFNQFVVQ